MSDHSATIPTRFVNGPSHRTGQHRGKIDIQVVGDSGKKILTLSPSVGISLNDRNHGKIVQNVSEVLHVVDPDSTHSQASICPQDNE